jgi:hypothetical protein
VVVSVSGRGVTLRELKYHGGWRAHYALLGVAKGTKLTVRARLDGLEVAAASHTV